MTPWQGVCYEAAMRIQVVLVLALVATMIQAAVAKDRPLPPQLLTAKTITVISHYGLTAGSHDLLKENQVRERGGGNHS
jgi:hypothetical protein